MIVHRLKRTVRPLETTLQRALATAGAGHSESKMVADADAYCSAPTAKRWTGNSHWRGSDTFDGNDLWHRIGTEHYARFERAARTAEFTRPWNRIVEWGCGGGTNATVFAPRFQEFVGVDITAETLAECANQVTEVCDTPFSPVRISVAEPESALQSIYLESCDAFVSFYVFELIPTPSYGARLLRIAHQLLAPGGLALIQIKYDDGRWTSRSRMRGYREQHRGNHLPDPPLLGAFRPLGIHTAHGGVGSPQRT
ncbi:class I SAM-dependent methyltransferase [Amycolatopsis roodepoortensis]|uniref:class I SAM-dependent methyltransferase n=1 Tax=Amycolatopsis roodepoortensis TaxID=700274 RepID=UPI00214C2886|nr:class I SAM-dependent methyltransferase [Amycolatopsis roodepoortensis]UUV28697.1 class I SAM-dependent methyltransferase [Amycolatopsis roodepoortensis]